MSMSSRAFCRPWSSTNSLRVWCFAYTAPIADTSTSSSNTATMRGCSRGRGVESLLDGSRSATVDSSDPFRHPQRGGAGRWRQMARIFVALGLAAHETFHQPILQRMKTDHRQPAAGREHPYRLRQRRFQLFQLTIDIDAQRLKAAGRRMAVALPGRMGGGDDLRQLLGGGDGRGLARLDDCAGNARGETLFAVGLLHLGDIRFAGPREPRRHALSPLGVHAQVEGAVAQEAEAQYGIVQLRRRYAEIEQYAAHFARHGRGLGEMLQHGERTLLNGETRIRDLPLMSCAHRRRITVDGNESSVFRKLVQNGIAMPSAPEGRVHIDPRGADLQGLHHLLHHDRVMAKYINHGRQSDSDSSSAGKGVSSSSLAYLCSRRSSQLASFHNSNLLP